MALSLSAAEATEVAAINVSLDLALADGVTGNFANPKLPSYVDFTLDVKTVVRNTFISTAAAIVKQLMSGAAAPWTNVASFLNGWVADSATYNAPAYKRATGSRILLRGRATTGTVDASMFLLPVGSRPLKALHFATISNNALGQIVVQADGNVVATSPSSNVWVSLEGISFDAEQ